MLKVVPTEPLKEPQRPAPYAGRSDDELMLLVRSGLSAALAVLVERHLGKLTNFCAKLLGDTRAAEEIVQETWIRIWKHRESYRSEGKFVVLLYTTARNLCRNHTRGARRRDRWLPTTASEQALDGIAANDADHLDALLERERQRDVHRALEAIPELMREALLLRFEEELAYEDIAAILGASESTIRSRVHHGLKQLRGHLAKGESR